MAQNNNYIFLVDDEPIQNEMLKDYLSSRFGYQFKTYETGEEAIRDLNLNPEIIVLDYHLNSHIPDTQNGVQVLQKIKELRPATQVIMLSGQDKLEVAIDSIKYGAYDYVVKGETAFSRMENILNNINELHGYKQSNKTYKLITAFLGVAIVMVILLSVLLVRKFDVVVPGH